MSFDTPEENRAFAADQGFPYRLLSDVDRSVGAAYGTKKTPDEKFADFASRMTYLIDPAGRVEQVYAVDDVTAHPDRVLADLRAAVG